ncbi:unnamed protein product [Rotaria magnacalcarata]|uniref:Uncharacterized protein n=1 Tax=Rotaria magnacalcarata TaxID=392030 RepID=A0A816LYF5_9BILA|nr:unnamed protein product [Rotaria magnacalcarata]CAF1937580.1 unnamed protein product [Rotaria magnacalcarata]CAF2059410.1 unnamed protein product [Rotaria magnacalcarata]CAF4111376.1 unnamed protein product [Rotaria magnacalcarata]CAF4522154.1 unnamed protein product [Rotaria magnacalcarata]
MEREQKEEEGKSSKHAINIGTVAQHVTIFQQDLCQLAEELKELCFLDIYGAIHREKVESYHSMVKTCFPNSQIYIGISRFRLWI